MAIEEAPQDCCSLKLTSNAMCPQTLEANEALSPTLAMKWNLQSSTSSWNFAYVPLKIPMHRSCQLTKSLIQENVQYQVAKTSDSCNWQYTILLRVGSSIPPNKDSTWLQNSILRVWRELKFAISSSGKTGSFVVISKCWKLINFLKPLGVYPLSIKTSNIGRSQTESRSLFKLLLFWRLRYLKCFYLPMYGGMIPP